MLKIELVKEAINKSGNQYTEEVYSNIKILSVRLNSFIMHLKFEKDLLKDIFCEYLEDDFKIIPLFILLHCQKQHHDYIRVIDNDLILCTNLVSISITNTVKGAKENLINMNTIFNQYKEKALAEYSNYLENTKVWLEMNCPEKVESLYAILNIPEDDYIIDIGENEYLERNLKRPSNGFIPFKVMVNKINASVAEVRLMVKHENGFRYFEYEAKNDINFSYMLETFAEWVSKGGPFGNKKHFYDIDQKKRILEYILKSNDLGD